ncbi:MAG: RluA family pseudouridine synthase [Lachnospiraceae bacterium]|nr:RluA family pseudouridine synthase [Lachnospiraceae bacterium]
MQSFQIGPNEAGQRFDKFLRKFLPAASGGFLYKMLRKKNIILNGKKAEGGELLQIGDQVSVFFSDETFLKFRGNPSPADGADPENRGEKKQEQIREYERAFRQLKGIEILYEDDNVIFLNKPAGILSQKAGAEDLSLNEWLIGYLLKEGRLTEQALQTFKPSVCNRLDRNTGGIVLCGKSLTGSRELNRLIRERCVKKFYRTFVKGEIREGAHVRGILHKDELTNRVTVSEFPDGKAENGAVIETVYEPVRVFSDRTCLDVELITGKSHQIRAHLAAIGHPVLGDPKYGDEAWNELYRSRYGVHWQLLYASRITFPFVTGPLENLSGRSFTAALPEIYSRLMRESGK